MNYSSHIVFINPPNSPFTSGGILIEPIDLLGVATWVQSLGHDCSIIDMDVKCLLAEDLKSIFKVWPRYLVIVFDYHIPLHDVGANQQIQDICNLAREHGTITILGGKAATFWDEDKLKRFNADIYIQHEMEYALKEILSGVDLATIEGIRYATGERKNRKREQQIDLNLLPIANRSLVDLEDYIDVRTLLSSRGCNLQCTFCHVPGFWGWWRGKKANAVVDEIEHLTRHHDAKKILFLDDNATVNQKRMREISQGLVDRDIKTTLGCLGTIDKYHFETLEAMYAGGFRWIHYGAESGDDKQLAQMGKRISAQKILEAVAGTKKAGLRVRTSWILDMPDLTDEGLKRTEELIIEQESEEIRLHFLTLRLGSILHQEMNGLETPQFIHNSQQNFNISGLASEKIEASTQRIIKALLDKGYVLVKNAHQFKDVEALRQISPGLKVVSLCPLRYGLGWKR